MEFTVTFVLHDLWGRSRGNTGNMQIDRKCRSCDSMGVGVHCLDCGSVLLSQMCCSIRVSLNMAQGKQQPIEFSQSDDIRVEVCHSQLWLLPNVLCLVKGQLSARLPRLFSFCRKSVPDSWGSTVACLLHKCSECTVHGELFSLVALGLAEPWRWALELWRDTFACNVPRWSHYMEWNTRLVVHQLGSLLEGMVYWNATDVSVTYMIATKYSNAPISVWHQGKRLQNEVTDWLEFFDPFSSGVSVLA